jgi:hypothetical protein
MALGTVQSAPRKMRTSQVSVRFDVLKATVFWNVAPGSLVDNVRRLWGGYYLHYPGDAGRKHL